MRKRWIVSVVATAVLALGVFGGTVLAQEITGGDDSELTITVTSNDIMKRVAEKLGIAEEDLQAAFDEVRSEIKDERTMEAIDALVDSGRITAEQGDDLQAWLEGRPNFLEDALGFRSFGFREFSFDSDFEFRSGPRLRIGPQFEFDDHGFRFFRFGRGHGATETTPPAESSSA